MCHTGRGILREDPRTRQRTTHYELLTAIADGATTPTDIGAAVGKDRTAIPHPLEVLETAGYVRHDQHLLKQRNPIITVPDPVIRFNQVVTLPNAPLVDLSHPDRARQAAPTPSTRRPAARTSRTRPAPTPPPTRAGTPGR
ncbi:hypothetical protein AB0I02_27240 [Streptomyces phaeochromogenes]